MPMTMRLLSALAVLTASIPGFSQMQNEESRKAATPDVAVSPRRLTAAGLGQRLQVGEIRFRI